MIPRLKEKYTAEISPGLNEKLGLANAMQIPRLDKIVVNMGIGEGITEPKQIESAMAELAIITGQKPRLNRSRKSIANFKLDVVDPAGGPVVDIFQLVFQPLPLLLLERPDSGFMTTTVAFRWQIIRSPTR